MSGFINGKSTYILSGAAGGLFTLAGNYLISDRSSSQNTLNSRVNDVAADMREVRSDNKDIRERVIKVESTLNNLDKKVDNYFSKKSE